MKRKFLVSLALASHSGIVYIKFELSFVAVYKIVVKKGVHATPKKYPNFEQRLRLIDQPNNGHYHEYQSSSQKCTLEDQPGFAVEKRYVIVVLKGGKKKHNPKMWVWFLVKIFLCKILKKFLSKTKTKKAKIVSKIG